LELEIVLAIITKKVVTKKIVMWASCPNAQGGEKSSSAGINRDFKDKREEIIGGTKIIAREGFQGVIEKT